MKRANHLLLLSTFLLLVSWTKAQQFISVTNGSTLTENFNSINTTTLELPTGWRMTAAGQGTASWNNPANIKTLQTNFTSINSYPPAGRILWPASSPNTSPFTQERSIGFYTSGAYPSSNAIMAAYAITSGTVLTGFTISFRTERHITNTNSSPSGSPTIVLRYSLDGTNWSAPIFSMAAFNSFFASGVQGNPSTVTDAGPYTTNVSSIITSCVLYLKWEFFTLFSGVHWGFAIDDVAFTPTLATGTPVSCVLPVFLKSFNAGADVSQNYNRIVWELEHPEKASAFEVELSTDGRTFSTIATVPVTSSYSYEYRHFSTSVAPVFYRLRIFEPNGGSSYSKTVTVEPNSYGVEKLVVQNPVQQELRFRHPPAKNASYTVMDAMGRTVLTGRIVDRSTQNSLTTSALLKGVYQLHYSSETYSKTERFVKE
jgi:hypothetical protein